MTETQHQHHEKRLDQIAHILPPRTKLNPIIDTIIIPCQACEPLPSYNIQVALLIIGNFRNTIECGI